MTLDTSKLERPTAVAQPPSDGARDGPAAPPPEPADRDQSPDASRVLANRGVPKIVALARSQTATGDDADGGS